MRNRIREGEMWLVFIVVMWLVLSLCGCSTTEYVPIKVETKDSIYLTKYVKDSIYVGVDRDMRTVDDTVWVTETRCEYRYKLRTDTMYIERVDSVQVPYPIERELSRWERLRMDWGGWAMALAVVMCVVVWWLIRAKKM